MVCQIDTALCEADELAISLVVVQVLEDYIGDVSVCPAPPRKVLMITSGMNRLTISLRLTTGPRWSTSELPF